MRILRRITELFPRLCFGLRSVQLLELARLAGGQPLPSSWSSSRWWAMRRPSSGKQRRLLMRWLWNATCPRMIFWRPTWTFRLSDATIRGRISLVWKKRLKEFLVSLLRIWQCPNLLLLLACHRARLFIRLMQRTAVSRVQGIWLWAWNVPRMCSIICIGRAS